MPNVDELRPSTIDGIKRLADRLQAENRLSRSDALNAAARRGGFENYAHARNAIEGNDARTLRSAEHSRSIARDRQEYRERTSREWAVAVDAVARPALQASTVWTSLDDIVGALEPFMGTGRNHGYFPTGGGHDFSAVQLSSEPGCIELAVGGLAYIVRPRRLRLERIPEKLSESFLFLELAELARSGTYAPMDGDEEIDEQGALSRMSRRRRESEELVDLGNGEYHEREVWDRGFVENEDDPLPSHARRVQRILRGTIMIVCKASIWNGIPQTYSGMHDSLGADRIREEIERSIARNLADA